MRSLSHSRHHRVLKAKRQIVIVFVGLIGFSCLLNYSMPCIPAHIKHTSLALLNHDAPLLIYSLVVENEATGINRTFGSERVRLNRERYVQLHEGIEYFHQTKPDKYTRLLACIICALIIGQKVKDYRTVKEGHEWVWLLDGDAFIMNGETSGLAVIRSQVALEARNSTKAVDIIMAKDFNGLLY
jgi:hypothetical protein